MADGGEGTCDLLTEWVQGRYVEVQVDGPLFRPLKARYGISKDGDRAFIEMASASGLTLLKNEERNPLLTSTIGTGQLIADALSKNVREIVLGLGGSATVDAGIGMASALGYTFCDSEDISLKPVGENLIHIRSIHAATVPSELKSVSVTALCDVTNPLFGPQGAAYVYGPLKGGNPAALDILDAGLRNFNRMAKKYLGASADFPGAGAAGGLGAGAKVFLQATIESGTSYIIATTNLEEKIRQADLVITGEGKIDEQTFSGKVVSEVTKLSANAGKPVVAVCGKCDLPFDEVKRHGVSTLISLVDESTTIQSAISNAEGMIAQKVAAFGARLPGFNNK
jgi:glycerate kinase